MKREEAIRIINDERVKYNIWETPHDISEEEWGEAFCMAVEALENYVEVVRCKDCKHRIFDESRDLYYCEMYYGMGSVRDNNYCSYGERADS